MPIDPIHLSSQLIVTPEKNKDRDTDSHKRNSKQKQTFIKSPPKKETPSELPSEIHSKESSLSNEIDIFLPLRTSTYLSLLEKIKSQLPYGRVYQYLPRKKQ